MVSSCNSVRCTRCGRKKRLMETVLSIEDNDLMDEEVLDGLWSPLEPLRGKHTSQQASTCSPDHKGSIITLNLVTIDHEPSISPTSNRKRKGLAHHSMRNKYTARRRNFSLSQIMQSFARGMASAFGTSAARRPGAAGRNFSGDDFELDNLRGSRSLLPSVLPSRSRLRYLFDRMQAKPQPLSPEQRPLAADYHENLSPYHPAMAPSIRLRAY
jgi:hypothetical protein